MINIWQEFRGGCLSLRLGSGILTHYAETGNRDTLSTTIIGFDDVRKGKEHLISRLLIAVPGSKCSSICIKKQQKT